MVVGTYDEPFHSRLKTPIAKHVAKLMDELKLKSASVMGISYGGEVALKLAVKYPYQDRALPWSVGL